MHTAKIILTLLLIGLMVLPVSGLTANLVIERGQNALQGHPGDLAITASGLDFELGQFRLLVAVQEEALALMKVEPGTTLQSCGYEEFSYRMIIDSLGEYDLGGFSRLIEIRGVLASPGGTYPCVTAGGDVELARLHLLASRQRKYECFFLPVGFYWRDCCDNALYSRQGDTMLVVDSLFLYWDTPYPIDLTNTYNFPGLGIPDGTCEVPPGVTPVRDLNGAWGGVDLACVGKDGDTWSLYRGDLNLNGFHYEASDLVTYVCTFVYGIGCFTVDPEGQVAASDINGDGIALSVADLVELMRIMVGEQYQFLPGWKLPPNAGPPSAEIAVSRDPSGATFELTTSTGLAAGWLRFNTDANAIVTVPDVPAEQGWYESQASVLLVDMENLRPVAAAGETVTIRVSDPEACLAYTELVDPTGAAVAVKESSPLPNTFVLSQNYPNPFNPNTTIAFSLPLSTDWQLNIFNILGQEIESFTGHDQGSVSVTWDAGEFASGVYFYQLQAGNFKETKRMLLLK